MSGGVQKVKTKIGDIVYVNLANGYRGVTPPLPFAKGGYTNERRHVNKAQDYEVRYAKPRPNRTGYSGKRSFDDGGKINELEIGQKYRAKNGDILTIKDFDVENHVTTDDGKGKMSSMGIQRITVFKELIKDGELIHISEDGHYDNGGEVRKMQLGEPVIYKGETWEVTQKNGVVGLTSMRQGAYGSDFPFVPISKIDARREVKDFYGNEVRIPYLVEDFEEGGFMTDPTFGDFQSGVYAKGGGISQNDVDRFKKAMNDKVIVTYKVILKHYKLNSGLIYYFRIKIGDNLNGCFLTPYEHFTMKNGMGYNINNVIRNDNELVPNNFNIIALNKTKTKELVDKLIKGDTKGVEKFLNLNFFTQNDNFDSKVDDFRYELKRYFEKTLYNNIEKIDFTINSKFDDKQNFAKGGGVYRESKYLTKEQWEKWNDYVKTGKIDGKKENNMFTVARHIGVSVAQINAYEREKYNNYATGGGVGESKFEIKFNKDDKNEGEIITPYKYKIIGYSDSFELKVRFRELYKGTYSFNEYNICQFIIKSRDINSAIKLAIERLKYIFKDGVAKRNSNKIFVVSGFQFDEKNTKKPYTPSFMENTHSMNQFTENSFKTKKGDLLKYDSDGDGYGFWYLVNKDGERISNRLKGSIFVGYISDGVIFEKNDNYATGGGVDYEYDAISYAKTKGKESVNWDKELREYAGSQYSKLTAREKEEIISDMQKDWDSSHSYATGGGVNWHKYPTKKVRGLYEIKGSEINRKVNIVFFEKYSDDLYFLTPLDRDRDIFKGIFVKSTVLNSLDKGVSVKGETNDGKKVSIKRIGNQDFSYEEGGVTKNYVNRNQLNTITIKKGDKKLTYKVSDVYNGAYKLEDGGNLERTAFYVSKRNVVKVQLKDGKDVKVANGYWIKKGAKPIHTSKYDDGGQLEMEYAGGGSLSNGSINYLSDLWFAVQQKDTNDYKMLAKKLDSLKVPFVIQNEVSADAETQRGRKALSISEVHDRIKKIVAKNDRTFEGGGGVEEKYVYKTNNRIFADDLLKYADLQNIKASSKKVGLYYYVTTNKKIEAKGSMTKELAKIVEEKKFKEGGKTTFKEKATAIAKNFEGKKVEPKYQKEYGKTYDKAEAKEVGNKIAGSQKAKYDSKMSGGGKTKRGGAMVLAKQIRKEGESWASALKRANEQMRNK